MIENPNYIWTCPKCGYREMGFKDGACPHSIWMRTKKCPNCKTLMEESPIIKKGPFSDDQLKRH